ncbi:MAG: sigma-70 family RNA polymerase sigma factor, partial [Clostridiales bacterium]
VYSITTNACRDEMVKRKKYTQFSIDEILVTEKGEISKEIVDETVCLENEYISKESVQHIHQLILSLSEDYRLVIVLRDQLGLSYQEIADRLDISLGTVKSRINRARKLLQTKILEDGELYPEINRLLNARRGK